MKMNLKKLQKTSMIFELTTLKLAYIQIFMKSLENFFDWFLANGGKNQDEDEKKKSKNVYDYWVFHLKIKWFTNVHENLTEKNVLKSY